MKTVDENSQCWSIEDNKPLVRLVYGIPTKNISTMMAEIGGGGDYMLSDHREHYEPHHNAHYDNYVYDNAHREWPSFNTIQESPRAGNKSSIEKHYLKLVDDLRISEEDFGSSIQFSRLNATTFVTNKLGTNVLKYISEEMPMKRDSLEEKISKYFNLKSEDTEYFIRTLLAFSLMERV